jgi:hypothetical protein
MKANGSDILTNKPGSKVLNAGYFESKVIDLSTDLDSLDDKDRIESVRGLIRNTIVNEVVKMNAVTGYSAIFRSITDKNLTPKITVTVGADLTDYVPTEIVVNGFEVEVNVEPNERLSSTIFVTFGKPTNYTEDTPFVLQYGVFAVSPNKIAKITRNIDGATENVVAFYPVFRHDIFLDCLVKIEVKDADVFTTKNIINMKTV